MDANFVEELLSGFVSSGSVRNRFFSRGGGGQDNYYYATMLLQAQWTGKKQQERQGRGEVAAVTLIIWLSSGQCIGLGSRSSYTREAGGEGGEGGQTIMDDYYY